MMLDNMVYFPDHIVYNCVGCVSGQTTELLVLLFDVVTDCFLLAFIIHAIGVAHFVQGQYHDPEEVGVEFMVFPDPEWGQFVSYIVDFA